ncbi:prephenate dehydrogenase/arogenate dehydrogenase family protein [Nocardia sp. CNY236]|uniref:prephenate dehydrogenase/arogenate dehydrogenase family protein n=1 Tax=Nocardia sp. CNY236 TaxID=1169152 RepID=UPI000403A8D9|nr:prephenate dehydrogenase/arogenate dehydrogenase family protein [Nocardia sp. CNY236]
MNGRVVIMGNGMIGRWIARDILASETDVVSVDLYDGDVVADVTSPDLELRTLVGGAETVVLSLPESVGVVTLRWVAQAVGANVPVVTTSSVQTPYFEVPQEPNFRGTLVGFTPMFSPALSAEGRPILVIADARSRPAAVDQVTEWARTVGAAPTVASPNEHDEAMRLVQILPHAAALGVAGVLASSDADVAMLWSIAPPPAKILLAVLARILGGSRETYGDIQRAVPAQDVRHQLREAIGRLDGLGSDSFAALLDEWANNIGLEVLTQANRTARDLYHLA